MVFVGGDLLPSGLMHNVKVHGDHDDFVNDFLVKEFGEIKGKMQSDYPEIFVILGNDDGRFEEAAILDAGTRGIWHYIHNRRMVVSGYKIFGYSFVPPTPFLLKDWERYDVSRYADPGCIHPHEGKTSFPIAANVLEFATIKDDLSALAGDESLENSIFLFHAPPYKSMLDRAALDGKMVDHAPLDVHVGSIAIQRFIKERKPMVTLHGHIHESPRLTGHWMEKINGTIAMSAAHDGQELALVRFNAEDPVSATRELI